ncbi:hypothetical protein C6W88_05330 [Halomonas litopenaei]|uniref:Uncharacterized protein n=1 Tax=Halomonas litopenaei TaxID=2109328 RepID=A0ABX5J0M4_9GAMM|nr:hypothetical protein C6W89_14630 [Halomonas sp. SYSU XM8]PTL95500.1 hypothetical protein C6W88_05330 [Halomonas litopenaei]
MRKRSLRGVNEHFDPIFNAVLPSAGTFQTSPSPLHLRSSPKCRARSNPCHQMSNRRMSGRRG